MSEPASSRAARSAPGRLSAGNLPNLVLSEAPGERITFWRPSATPEMELMVGERSPRLWKVFHETYTVCLVPPERNPSDFRVDWRYRGRSLAHPSGGALLMEPGEVHATRRLSAAADFWVVQVDPRFVARAARRLGLPSPPHLQARFTSLPPVVRALRRLHAATVGESTPLEQQSRLVGWVTSLLEHCAESGRASPARSHPGVRRARDFLAEHCFECVGLTELAAVAELSRFHLVRCFAAHYGLPPHAYQVQMRISAARRMLRAGLPLARVAADTGFADQSHFGRHFKRAFGVSPGRYAAEGVETRARTF